MPTPPSHPLAPLRQETTPDLSSLQPSAESQLIAPGKHPLRPPGSHFYRADLPVTVATVLSLALPTLIEQIVSFGIRFTDTIVAGNTGSDDASCTAALAAVGNMTYLLWFAALNTAALGVGATAIVARAIGAHRPRLANRVAGTACAAAFLISLAVGLLFFLFPHPIVHLFGLRGLAEEYAIKYLQIMCFTVCFQSIAIIGNACLRGAGDTLRPMIVTITSTLITVTAVPVLSFDYLGFPAMGIQGNAIGTLLAFAVSALMTVAFLLSGSAGLQLRKNHFKILPHVIVRILRIGIPSGFENTLLWGGQVLIVALATKATDSAVGTPGVTLAAHQAILTIESLAFLPGFGFGIACSALVGQYLGAKKAVEAAHAVKLCRRLAFLTMTAAAIPMILFPHFLLNCIIKSHPAILIGVIPLALAGLAQPGFAVHIVNSAALRGAGDTISPMIATITGILLRLLLVLVLLAAFAHFGYVTWGLTAVWIAIFIDLNYRALFNTIVFRTGKWKLIKV